LKYHLSISKDYEWQYMAGYDIIFVKYVIGVYAINRMLDEREDYVSIVQRIMEDVDRQEYVQEGPRRGVEYQFSHYGQDG
jgi:hypothetical protein